MMNNPGVSDELLNSFVDNELDRDERSELFSAINQDEALKGRVCELRNLKEMVQHVYLQPPVRAARKANKKLNRGWSAYIQGLNFPRLAVCMLLLSVGWVSGWLMFANSELSSNQKVMRLFQATQSSDIAEEPNNVIVQVSNSNPVRLKTALDETENLLAAYKRAHRELRVEIIASAGGIDLLRSDVSPFAKRIALLQAKYPNLDYMACHQTIDKLQGRGVKVRLLPNIRLAPSAVEQINKRLQQGWDYVRV